MATKRIVIGVDDQFSSPLKRYENAMGGAVNATEKFSRAATSAGGGGWRQMSADLRDIGLNAQFLYQTFSGVLSKANEWAQVGLSAARNEMAFRSLAGSADDYREKIDAITRATRGMVTEGEAAGTAYRLQRFGLADTADEMERFMRTVSIVSAINPQLGGTAEAINQIQLTLSNMSYMRLDQLGVSAGQVRARMAELKAETKGLSDEQAFQTAVMEQLDQQANAVGDSILEMNDASERMQARWRGFKEDWGLKIAQGFEAITGAAEGAAAAIDKVGWEDFLIEASNQVIGTNIPHSLGWGRGTPQGPSSTATPEQLAFAKQYYEDFQQGFGYQNPTQVQIPHDLNYWYYYNRQSPEQVAAASKGYFPQLNMGPRASMAGFADMMGYSDATWAASQLPAGRAIPATPRIGMGIGAETDFAAAQQNMDKMARSSAEVNRNLTDAATTWGSLDEKFGISATGFDTDVYSEMASALNDVGVEGGLAERAMTAYQLATGMATGSSLLFDNQLSDLTQQFADGKLSVDEYTQLVMGLGQMDLSWVDRYAQQMAAAGASTDQINAAMQSLSDNWQKNFAAQGKGTASSRGGKGEEGGGAGDPFSMIQRGSEQALSSVQTFSTESQTAFTEFSSVATEQVGVIDTALGRLDNRTIHISAIVDLQTQIENSTASAEGGSAGYGGQRALGGPVLGGRLYEVTEGGVPELYQSRSGRQYMMTPRGGGRVIPPRLMNMQAGGSAGGGVSTIVIQNVTDKRITSEQVVDVSRLRGNR